MVKIAEMWERTSQNGTKYFSGYAGPVQYLLFDAGEKEHPTRPGERVHVWRLMLQESDPERRPQKRDLPTQGQQTHEAMRQRADSLRRNDLQ